MDLIRFATYIIQELTDERKPYERSLLELPITDSIKANADNGYARGLRKAELIMRKAIREMESGNYKAPAINIDPIESLFQTDKYSLIGKGPNE